MCVCVYCVYNATNSHNHKLFLEFILQNRGNRHTLIIRNVTYSDLGNYTCQAANNLGKDRASLTLSGIPSICEFDSVSINDNKFVQVIR